MHVRPIMRKPVVTIGHNADLETARRRMAENGVGSLVVVDGRGLAKGVITRADLSTAETRTRPASFRLEARPGRHTKTNVLEEAPVRRVSVDKLVKPDLPTLLETDTVIHAKVLMDKHDLTHLVVLRDGKAVGILARSDLDNLVNLRAAPLSRSH
jgi:CBS domain-containing protein